MICWDGGIGRPAASVRRSFQVRDLVPAPGLVVNRFVVRRYRTPTVTITTIMTDVATFFGQLISVLYGLLVTTGASTLTPLQIIMWAGLVLGFLTFVIGLVKRLASQG